MAKKQNKARRRYAKRAAIVGGAAATATALTVAMAPASTAAAAGPDYTQLITDSSNSLNNILFIAGNLGGAGADLWNPLATAIPGGLLPTFTAGTQQNDLTSIAGLLAALASATDLSGVPGLPANATQTILAGLVPGLGPVIVVLGPVLGSVGSQLELVSGVLAALDAVPLLDGVPTLGDLLGLTATQTTFNSTYEWPLLGLGPLLGLQGSTTISNTFAQLPSLTGPSLITGILSGLNVAGQPISSVPGLPQTVAGLLAPLGVIATPSVTAWIPAGSGNYGLPLGGSFGWLATMPTVAVGPVAVGPVVLSDTDTVVAIPIFAAGAVLPLGLASFGTVSTPGVVFPTATGVSTLGGTSLSSFTVPGLGLSLTNLNVLSATYVGTNGINYNSGTSLATLVTPLGALPIVYSLGSYNIGTTGFGFTGPSLFTVGLLPSFQVGTAPTQQSPDGLIPASVLNLGLSVPTQTTDLVTILGLPNPGAAVTPILNPAFNIVVVPVGSQITNALNGSVGPLTNGLASLMAQLTGLLAEASGSVAATVPPASPAVSPAAAPDLPSAASVPDPDAKAVTVTSDPAPVTTASPPETEPATPRTRPRLNVVTQMGNPGTTLVDRGTNQVRTGVTNVQNQVRTVVTDVTKQVTDTITSVTKQVRDSLSSIGSQGDTAGATTSSSTSTDTE